MNSSYLRELLESVKEGKIDIDEALNRLKLFPYEDCGFAKIDHHRSLRTGFPEVVFCQGKTVEQLDAQRDPEFWLREQARISEIDSIGAYYYET